MKELKFRVWNGECMISPDHIDKNGWAHWKQDSIPVSSKNIMQYVGVKDNCGKEIYEGDILRFCFTEELSTNWNNEDEDDHMPNDSALTIVQDDGVINGEFGDWYSWTVKFATDAEYIFEVIGNIYENPILASSLKRKSNE